MTAERERCDIAGVTRTPEPSPEQPESDEKPIDLELEIPDPNERDAGAVAHFKHSSPEGWRAAGTVSQGRRGLVISRLEVWPDAEGAAPLESVTSRTLRAIPLGYILSEVQRWTELLTFATVRVQTADEILAAHHPEGPSPGRAPLPDELLRQVAEGYLAETSRGLRGAVKRLSDQLGRPEKTVSNWVAKARRDGWLGPASQGRAGATPGPRLLDSRNSAGQA